MVVANRRTELGRAFLRLQIATVVLFVLLLVLGGWVWSSGSKRTSENCHQTFIGIREVFRPFLPPPPKGKLTPAQKVERDNFRKFNRTVDRLESHC